MNVKSKQCCTCEEIKPLSDYTGIGLLKEDITVLESAIKYLKRYKLMKHKVG